ncbi:MAG: TetR/AcrR family transcriptional regulator [Myxococcota bacterium]
MGRRAGSRNADYAKKRKELAQRVAEHLMAADKERAPCLGRCAEAAGVSVPTLKHYFGDRQGVLQAALGAVGTLGEVHVAKVAQPQGGVRESLSAALLFFAEGWAAGLRCIVESGVVLSTESASLGPSFLRDVLEPLILALERRLACHIDRGELRLDDTRVAALALWSPVVVALLHQDSLGGQSTRPLDLPAFIQAHVDGFLSGYAIA